MSAATSVGYARVRTPVGVALAAWTRTGVVALSPDGLWFGGRSPAAAERAFLAGLRRAGLAPCRRSVPAALAVRIRRSIAAGDGACADLSALGVFSRRVLQATCRIPRGETRTYGEIARAAGRPAAARAAGGALARNPVPLIVPCHRVVRADGSLGGYGGPRGTETKRRLLESEGATARGPGARPGRPARATAAARGSRAKR
ncbi:MAG: methylated-DNA--[protein]-cysteine S-methyltransferase [Acidobacteria bacterium]|nr:methylated-DNA--[protein]-cysteine S-methyltransferase [Acidobacteriota bacterium]